MKVHIERSLSNIIHFGDTDIFPFLFERNMFEENFDACLDELLKLDSDFENIISSTPPITEEKLSQVGYFGFRKATQIEPFWNAYYLALVLSIAEDIEAARIPIGEDYVFSYRYEWSSANNSCFKDLNWIDYKRKCLEHSRNCKFVVQTDISDFYSRINHHKLENELNRISREVSKRIMKTLSSFSGTVSYGLPVGGPASRLLAELALNHCDRHLKSRGVQFCRYADDYSIFCESESEAYKILILLADKLSNEGLGLQKTKTKIISADEFVEIHSYLDPLPSSDPVADEEQKLLEISIRYDPYSDTAHEDYEKLKEAVGEIDIVGILSKEVHKTRIDQTVTKQAIKSIQVLDKDFQYQSMKILLDNDNLLTLAPVFTSIIRAVRAVYLDLEEEGQILVDRSLLRLFNHSSHLVNIEINLNYVIQVLALKHSSTKEELMINLFENSTDHLLRRQIILIMANWNCDYWLVDIKKHFNSFTVWERRAFICASYVLGDAGDHWRKHNRKSFDNQEIIVRDWAAYRKQKNRELLV